MRASDLFDVSDEYLEAVQENGWPWAEWVRFSASDRTIAVIDRMFAGEVCTNVVDRWRVTDLVRGSDSTQLELPHTR